MTPVCWKDFIHFKSIEVNKIVFVTMYCAIMFFLGLMIALIDIPLIYFMQREIPDEYRGRVLSIGLSLGKMMQPIALLSSTLDWPSFYKV